MQEANQVSYTGQDQEDNNYYQLNADEPTRTKSYNYTVGYDSNPFLLPNATTAMGPNYEYAIGGTDEDFPDIYHRQRGADGNFEGVANQQ